VTDPVPLVAMAGFPPTIETRVTSTNWNDQPWLQWTHLNRHRMLPAPDVWRGEGPVWQLECADRDLSQVRVGFSVDAPETPLLTALAEISNNGLLVLHRGRIVHETYRSGMRPEDRHMVASISKSITALLAGILAGEGVVELDRPVHTYVEELRTCPIGGATLQELMDMRAGVRPPHMTHRGRLGTQDGGLYEAMGLMTRVEGSPDSLCDMALRSTATGRHGEQIHYDNAQTEALGWALRRAAGMTGSELLSKFLWQRLGAERDAFIVVDRLSSECFSGGMAMTLRDLARLGELLRCAGARDGAQIVPASFIDDLHRADSKAAQWPPGGSFRSSFHVLRDVSAPAPVTLVCNGRFGQWLWVAPQSEVVIAVLSSLSGPPPSAVDPKIAALCTAIAAGFHTRPRATVRGLGAECR
jgi:CubicO group peptidase (beta-lactamase class C family)